MRQGLDDPRYQVSGVSNVTAQACPLKRRNSPKLERCGHVSIGATARLFRPRGIRYEIIQSRWRAVRSCPTVLNSPKEKRVFKTPMRERQDDEILRTSRSSCRRLRHARRLVLVSMLRAA